MDLRLHFFKKSSLFKLILLLMILSSLHSAAQLHPDAIKYRSGFFSNYYTNPDSALFYARKLASEPKYASFLRQAIHEDVFLNFLDENKQIFKNQSLKNNDLQWTKKYAEFLRPINTMLYKMYTNSNPVLANASKPLYIWVNVHRIQQDIDEVNELVKLDKDGVRSLVKVKAGKAINILGSEPDIARIKQLIKEFLASEMTQKNLYQNRTGTYALLIYRDIVHDKSLHKQAEDLLSAIMKATLGAVKNIDVNTASDIAIEGRALNRYIYATANYFKANSLVQEGDYKAATTYFKTAAEYSPDLTDLGKSNAFLTEVYLFGDKQMEHFQAAYFDHLRKYSDKDSMLAALTQMALRNPVDHKAELGIYYADNFVQQENFNSYWRKAINKGLAKAPPVHIQTIDGRNYSSAEKAGKWILVDFWGTWCAPCRIEHPLLQQLYLKSKSVPSANLDIITIACNDTKEKVAAYMTAFKYTYPVAINDKKITKAYNVRGYPTKALITPEGNYMFIPFNSDWIKFIEEYIED